MGVGKVQSLLFGRNPKRTFWRIAALIVASYVVFGYILLPVRGEGISMLPTFADDQIGFVNALSYVLHPPRRGDVVAIRMAGRRVMYVKRVVGLPGERIEIKEGVVFANGVPLSERYVARGPAWHMREMALDSDDYLVIGDNRRMRIELHDLGAVDRQRIVGKVLF